MSAAWPIVGLWRTRHHYPPCATARSRRAGRADPAARSSGSSRSQANGTLNEALRGEPPPAWTRRPNAKDGLRARARQLREQCLAYHEIAAAAVQQVGTISEREILIAGAIAYWCEGAKSKPHRRTDRVDFINSDAAMIEFFVRFPDSAGISRDRLIFRVSIHENGDVPGAQRFWLDVTQAAVSQFRQPQIKRHNPRTEQEEHRRRLSRLPARPGAPQHRAVPADRRLGDRIHVSAARQRWPQHRTRTGLPPGDAPGRGFEPRLRAPKTLVLPG